MVSIINNCFTLHEWFCLWEKKKSDSYILFIYLQIMYFFFFVCSHVCISVELKQSSSTGSCTFGLLTSVTNQSGRGILESMISPPAFWNGLCCAHDALNVAKVGRPLHFATKLWRIKKTRFFSIFWWTFRTAWKCWMWKCFKLCDAQTPAHSFLLLAAALEDVQISHWEWCKPPQVWLMFSESICEIHQMKAICFSLVKLDIQVNALPGKQINRSHFPVVSC